MATIKCTVQRSSYYEVYFEYSYTQDKAKAETALTHALKLKQLTNSYDFDTVADVTVSYVVAGKTFSKTARINIDDKGNKGYTITLASGTSTIVHNSSTGVGSFTVSVDTKIESGGYGPGTIKLASTSVPLPTIYRASVPRVDKTSVRMGGSLTIYTDRKSSDFRHTINYAFGGATGTIKTDVGASWVWNVPDLAAKCNNAFSGTATITCITYNGSTKVGEETCTVTLTVPEATTPVFTNDDVIIGSSNPIQTKAGSANFSHVISYYFNGKSGYVNEDKLKSGIVWQTPADLAKAITSDSDTGSITCTTYNGTYAVGTITVDFTGVVPDTETFKPKITTFSITPYGSLPAAFSGLYIQGKTGVAAGFTASSTYSTIDQYKLTVDGRNFFGNPVSSSAFTRDGNLTVTGTVTDKRGFSKTTSKDVTVYPYSKPALQPSSGYSAIVCERSDQDGTPNDAGTYLHIKCRMKYSPVTVNGVQKNFCSLKYQYKVAGGSWSSEKTLVENTSAAEYEGNLLDVVSQTDKSYTIRLIVVDTIGSREAYEFPIPTADVTMHLGEGGYGVAFGKYSEATPDDKMVELAGDWSLVMDGSAVADFVVEQGTSGNWAYRKWASGKAECWGKFEVTAMITEKWGSLYIDRIDGFSLPSIFSHAPICVASSNAMVANNGDPTTSKTQPILLINPNTREGTLHTIQFVVYGRWK